MNPCTPDATKKVRDLVKEVEVGLVEAWVGVEELVFLLLNYHNLLKMLAYSLTYLS